MEGYTLAGAYGKENFFQVQYPSLSDSNLSWVHIRSKSENKGI